MTFDEIPIRMMQLGVDRPWLCAQCDYSPSTLASVLAPKGTNKTDKALRRIWEALDREEARQKSAIAIPAPLGHRVFIEPTEEQFDTWMQAVYHQPGRTFDTWAKEGLDALAEEELANIAKQPTLKVAEGNGSHLSTPASGAGGIKYPKGRKKSG